MFRLDYTITQKRRASTLIALGSSEFEAASTLIEAELYREAVVHMYFACFYLSQAFLVSDIRPNPSHKNVERGLHGAYGTHDSFPRRYVMLHSFLHDLRNELNYRSTHVPSPRIVSQKQKILAAYLRFALKRVPRLEIVEMIQGIYTDNKSSIKDFSFDIYCPKTYSHHTRLTIWQPPFYFDIFRPKQLARHAQNMLKALRVKNAGDYVVGLNSKLDQYSDVHLVMLDIDSVAPAVEAALKPVGGILLKSGRGFHFIGSTVVKGQKEWRAALRRLRQNKDLKSHIDKNHVEMSFDRGYSTLRITESKVKPQTPFFYKQL